MILVDLQDTSDHRNIELDQVGIKDLAYPISVLDRHNQRQETIARLSLAVSLPAEAKGTHMSRFVEVVHAQRNDLSLLKLPRILEELRQRLGAGSAHVELRFPYFLERSAPASKQVSLLDYQCGFEARFEQGELDLQLHLVAPITTLCSCSKAISDYGAHNQRGYLSLSVHPGLDENGLPQMIWIEELVEMAESSASAPIYPLLKRVDERQVTMQAYENPAFVEDVVRNAALRLRADQRITGFTVECVNHESIHNHNAYARTSWRRP